MLEDTNSLDGAQIEYYKISLITVKEKKNITPPLYFYTIKNYLTEWNGFGHTDV